MLWFTPLPPILYEIFNCALFAGTTTWLVICIRYLATAYLKFRNAGFLSRWEAFVALGSHRVGIGLMVFLCGESPRMGYLWLIRYLGNTGHDVAWLSEGWLIFFPVVANMIAVIGCACSVRAIIPDAWGRFGYSGTLLIVLGAIVATQVFR